VALRRAGRVTEAEGMTILEGGAFAFDIAEEVGGDLDEAVELALIVDPAVERSAEPPTSSGTASTIPSPSTGPQAGATGYRKSRYPP
jgi:hypothetical protein